MQYNALESLQAFEAGQGQRKAREQEAGRMKLGNALAGGDYKGGASMAYGMGDLETGMKLQEYGKGLEDAEAEAKRVGLIKTGMGLLQTPLEQREAMRPQLAQTLQQFGVQLDPQQLAQMDLSDEGIRATLTTLQDTDSLMAQYQSMMAPPEEYTLAPGAQRLRGDEVIASNVKPEAPLSTMGKLAADLNAGRITQAQYDGEVSRMQRGQPSLSLDFGEGGSLAGITYGSAPKGQEAALVRTREGNAAVTPSPQQEAYNKARRGLDEFVAQNSIVLGDIDMALQNVGAFSTGAGAALKDFPIIGGITPAGQMESLMETIRANVGFDKLQAMREASPTGGALGSVTERELAFLQAVFGSLRQDISPENVTRNLTRLREHMVGREQRIKEAFAADFPTVQETAQFRAQTNQQIEALTAEEAAELAALRAELEAQ